MKYQPPIGGSANDPYVNGDDATGVEGSIPPAAAIEHPMREIVHVIEQAGLTPSGTSLTQLHAAIQALTTARFAGANQLLNVNGFQKLPGSLILQWGFGSSSIAGEPVHFPVVFPNGCLCIIPVHQGTDSQINTTFGSPSKNGFVAYASKTGGPWNVTYVSIGH